MLLRKICQAIARCCAPTYPPPTYCRRSFLPQLTVRFTDEFLKLKGIPYEENQEQRLGELWEELRKRNPGIRLRPLFSGATGAGRKKFEAFIQWVASRNRDYKPPNFFALFRIVGPAGTDFLEIAKRLSAAEVEGVRVANVAKVLQPAVGPVSWDNQPRYASQGHLKGATDGINAQAAWVRPGGDGAGVRFVDVERGWLLNHEDLPPNLNSPAPVPLPLYGLNDSWAHDHGTPVLGILCAMDDTYYNAVGGVGIAPRAEGYVSSWFEGYDDVEGSERSNHAEAIRVAKQHLWERRIPPGASEPTYPLGDVLLLEAQLEDPKNPSMKWPLDTDPGIADVVGLATAAGIIVVEAGGNGDGSSQYFDPDAGSPPYNEAGAILVSAARIVDARIVPWGYAPRGNRVDCFAWGDGINTCWADGGGATNLYAPTPPHVPAYGGTSAAAAIVAGAAIVLQGIARRGAGPLTPARMRAMLRDRALNTLPADESPGNPYKIGCMPDLAKLIAALDVVTLGAPPP